MPSSRNRKKNKGKERKAKKEESERECVYKTWNCLVRGAMKLRDPILCNHGSVEIPDISHPVSSFMHTFFYGDRRAIQQIDIWNNECYRKMAVQMLIRMAATNLIGNKDGGLEFAWGLVNTILVLENYDETGNLDDNYFLAGCNRIAASKNRDVCVDVSSRRDMLKFYRKRMSCKCLKKMHLEARKTQPKIGKCDHCKVEKERSLLMVCSRCMVIPYCSRECQVAASLSHRNGCDQYVEAQEQTVANISE